MRVRELLETNHGKAVFLLDINGHIVFRDKINKRTIKYILERLDDPIYQSLLSYLVIAEKVEPARIYIKYLQSLI